MTFNESTSSMFQAAKEGDVNEVVRLLPLSDPLMKDFQEQTALMLAANNGFLECLKTLLPSSDSLAF